MDSHPDKVTILTSDFLDILGTMRLVCSAAPDVVEAVRGELRAWQILEAVAAEHGIA